ncbi:hypothetical protein NVIRENTERO_00197 [Sodalis praecaptivus]|nr:hypothetical protein NVIRENTERO_00197 [Sodalis praecaptivus]
MRSGRRQVFLLPVGPPDDEDSLYLARSENIISESILPKWLLYGLI